MTSSSLQKPKTSSAVLRKVCDCEQNCSICGADAAVVFYQRGIFNHPCVVTTLPQPYQSSAQFLSSQLCPSKMPHEWVRRKANPFVYVPIQTPQSSELMLRLDCRRLFPDHGQCPPGTCTNARSECKPIELDLFQAMRHSSVQQDGNY